MLCVGLLDTGSESTIVRSKFVQEILPTSRNILSIEGTAVKLIGQSKISVIVQDEKPVSLEVNAIVVDTLPAGIDIVLGTDFMKLGDECKLMYSEGKWMVSMVCTMSEPVVKMNEKDFEAVFDGEQWRVKWKWKDDKPPKLCNRVASYGVEKCDKDEFDKELNDWKEAGWLKEVEGEFKGPIIPLLAVRQETKKRLDQC